ncbi:MAG: cytochrome P450 [Actinobacteria bacterium]|nr:cytochrome P450 [Actinomycetota bacterium]
MPDPERTADLTDLDLYRDGFPHAVFTTLRRDEPVRWQPFPTGFPGEHDPGFWVLSRYEDIQAANRDPELFSAHDGPQLSHQPGIAGSMLVSMDGPDHSRLRRLISAGFTPRMVRALDEQARAWAGAIVDRALEHGRLDFVSEIAYQLPMNMIADIVGIPIADREHVFSVTNQFLLASDSSSGTPPADPGAAQAEMFAYAHELGVAKRAHPSDDVWTLLCTVAVEADDGTTTTLNELELDLFFMLLTVAGSETTRNAISIGLMTLLEHPDQLARMRSEPATMRDAVEEILRWSSPVGYFARRATRDTEIRGVPIAAGDRVTLWYPSGNRDEEVFDDPFRFDITRSPNLHLAFGGGGPHYCLGANLARREITILFEELFARVRHIEQTGPPVYSALTIENPILVALTSLPVELS